MRKILFIIAYFYAVVVFAGLPIPKDQNSTPMYTAQGRVHLAPAFTLTLNTYVDVFTLPATGDNYQRIWKHIIVRNPDANRTVYVCFGNSTSCTTDMIKIPPALGLAIDDVTYGFNNSITDIWMRLDSGGSVSPDLMVW